MNMNFTIATRLRPFSHLPGTRCMIPGTSFIAEVFPALIRLYDLKGQRPHLLKEIPLEMQGPLQHFTVFQDLERRCVTVVSDRTQYHILPTLDINMKKNPETAIGHSQERLSLGSHKKQEWELLKSREDFCSIFPLWFRLGQLLSLPQLNDKGGIFSLLEECQKTIDAGHPEKILPAFRSLFLAGFSSLLVPRLEDEEFQGIRFSTITPQSSPLHLLTEGALLIRSLFFLSEGHKLRILPHLPPAFFAGRFLNVFSPFGDLSFEWSKKALRCARFLATQDGYVSFHVAPLQSFRVRQTIQERGKTLSSGEEMEIKSGTLYLLDRFKK